MQRTHSLPSSRVGRDISSFSQEDKFEVCLNLFPLVKMLVKCQSITTWAEMSTEGGYSPALNAESGAEFLDRGFSPRDVGHMTVTPLIPAMIQEVILSDKVLTSSLKSSANRRMNKLSEYITRHNAYIQLRHFLSATLGSLQQRNMAEFAGWKDKIANLPLQVMNALAVQEDLQEIANMSKKLQSYVHGPTRANRAAKRSKIEGGGYTLKSLGARVHVMKNFIVFDWKNKRFLVPTVYFLEIYGKTTEMVNLLLYLHFSSGSSFPKEHWESSLEFLRHCARELTRGRPLKKCEYPENARVVRDNQGFLYMKTMEAIGVGIMSLREDMENFQVENKLLLETMWGSLYDEQVVDCEYYEQSELYGILYPLQTEQIADLLGVVKIFGHPVIDIIGGLSKLETRVKKILVIDNETLRNSLGKMRIAFVIHR